MSQPYFNRLLKTQGMSICGVFSVSESLMPAFSATITNSLQREEEQGLNFSYKLEENLKYFWARKNLFLQDTLNSNLTSNKAILVTCFNL